jgi:hypothetical protein
VLPADSSTPENWEICTFNRSSHPFKGEEVDLGELFPNGYISIYVATDPLNGGPLPYPIRIFIDNLTKPCQINRSVRETLSGLWMGSVVVMRYNCGSFSKQRGTYAHIKGIEIKYILCTVAE